MRYSNEARQKAGLPVLKVSGELQQLAEKHSRDMASRNYFAHATRRLGRDLPFEKRVSPESLGYKSTAENIALQPIVVGRQITKRTSSSGEVTREVKENVATYEQLARKTVQGWMDSTGHRKNMLTREFNRIGIGVAAGNRDETPYLWITQDLAQQ